VRALILRVRRAIYSRVKGDKLLWGFKNPNKIRIRIVNINITKRFKSKEKCKGIKKEL
jgi:hypothetical protein